MQTFTEIGPLRAVLDEARHSGQRIGFVPTMGALHEGHLQLVDTARKLANRVVVSIFVNPTQFGPGEDFERYPRNLEQDEALLQQRGATWLFYPDVDTMYPKGAATTVTVDGITKGLCGASRPGHFSGVATVVTKLFNIVGPCVAVFGRKDYQQLQVIKRLARDLNMPVKVIGVPTVREADGLAYSSRNVYLTPKERQRATALAQALGAAHRLFGEGASVEDILTETTRIVTEATSTIDYITLAHPETLTPVTTGPTPRRLLLAIAVKIGQTRLIDNTVLGEDRPPIV